jgi:predicted nucleic acid-binding protein
LEAKSRIYIDVLVASEFINTYARLQWRLSAPGEEFKAFRNSPDFRPVAREIADNVKRVLSHCSRVESGFDALDADDLLDEYAQGGADFNDQVIRNLCRSRSLKLITDDRDFNGQGIAVLTANRRLLG